jgi:hydroxymethylbilane synthase
MISANPLLKLGTRGSPLAMAQAVMVQRELAWLHEWPLESIEIIVLKTTGDAIQDRPLSEIGGKGLFTKELEEALKAGTIDIAVHSMKDVATRLPEGLAITAMLPREDYRDRLISLEGKPKRLEHLPLGARIGTSSLRRAAQLRHARPDIEIVPFRGNVGTRLTKLRNGDADATILAAAGLNRLDQAEMGEALPIGQMLPAVAQGAVGIEMLASHKLFKEISALSDVETFDAVTMERIFLDELEGSCRTPIAALARWNDMLDLELRGELLLPDGSEKITGQRVCDPSDAARAARELAVELYAKASPALRAVLGKKEQGK